MSSTLDNAPSPTKYRLSAELAPDVADALKELAQWYGGITITEVVRRAISNEVFLKRKQEQGGRVLIEDKNGKLTELVFYGK